MFIKVSLAHRSCLVIFFFKGKFCVSASVGKSLMKCLLVWVGTKHGVGHGLGHGVGHGLLVVNELKKKYKKIDKN